MGWQLFFIPLFFGNFRFSSYLCTISEGNDGMLMFLIMRNGGGFHRSFWAAAVGGSCD